MPGNGMAARVSIEMAGQESFGFRGDLWTCPRVAKVIEGEFGVKYHPAHMNRMKFRLLCRDQ